MNSNPLELSLADQFTKERFSRAIDESRSVSELQSIAKVLLDGWLTQKSATQWILRQALQPGPKFKPEDVLKAVPDPDLRR